MQVQSLNVACFRYNDSSFAYINNIVQKRLLLFDISMYNIWEKTNKIGFSICCAFYYVELLGDTVELN